ncbi:ASCH domain-containing protein [Geosporobacter ferrireducens]|uniref:ASCH domain-containing protein n=1 Tax=Geosporobacter ferrireducens TaxID=1424294 RepID=A0A1D8GMX7_9FIRM|nr:ASCH domain-containing protein [Geosporobacter ferrireducens]AOT72217.1 hypothetical protein Gferi_23340 [Geosporobacter ferrireducens]MTI56111.1 ASCH domain-containing protein [Geosporobacter ferrireducens]
MKVLLSIKPEYVEKIFNGEKRYEYRKSIFKKNIDTIVIYSTKPEGKIVGEFKIEDVLHDNVDAIWDKTNEYSGINYTFFKDYFKNRDNAYAIKIGKIKLYDTPLDPKDFSNVFRIPQSFCYIDRVL